ncbi:MAG: macrocin O-methyltransferase [Candidatus Raymondbacteria bacterium RifOxyA12_full_50_37]|nr:MAG: macrocin O-methyltransferase [Candidatus Raymondbacteria bacterium RifOxyA12_full_50_37]OGJ88530.1 MAG: macrocin O-methyltransferase [Candidatus Raymondbacteria bacterium RIFOXYA2_FULL_49_16]OGJ98991.1 MAG: macrocin O-methyltransferase [Candidatus Raymondbacteria bacterium RIFOXYC2_FULL_50_21]OGK00627.1 MAG: macrocin O-methyltransferase [Candidatus Raymondbacteria bacterium RifOxyC12_full_50_8]OGP41501.1 MAG: macrocin O-methyltransferase [Candidatus Raymondbacteria bacterium RIFOXYB2_FU
MDNAKELYLDLLKKALTFYLWEDRAAAKLLFEPQNPIKKAIFDRFLGYLKKRHMQLANFSEFDPEKRKNGLDWPLMADTMIGLKRLDNIQFCVESVIKDKIPGDLIETGVWRGGAIIFMRAILKAHGVTDRVVWAADSFEGLPAPDVEKYPADAGSRFHQFKVLQVTLESVKANIEKYGMLDDQVKFLKGWFTDTLPGAPIKNLAVLRLDGDMYESTMDGLINLYPKVSKGGFIIVDDYGIAECQKAIDDYRKQNSVNDTIVKIDASSVYWRRL